MTRDPEVKTLPSGSTVANFGLATNYIWKTESGEKKEKASFHNCTAFGKKADVIGQYVTKGQELYVRGRIDYQEWEKEDGSKGYRTQIMVEDFQFGVKAKGAADQGEMGAVKDRMKNVPAPKGKEAEAEADAEIRVEDIPF